MTTGRGLKFTFRQGGSTIETGGAYKILAADGLSASGYETVGVESPFLPGETVISQRALPRHVKAVMDCHPENRDFVLRFFKPGHEGELTVRQNGVERRIAYLVDGFRIDACNVHFDLMTFTARLRCPEPFFRSMSDFGYDIAAVTPLEIFPSAWEAGTRWFPDYRDFSTRVLVDNCGDVEIGLRLEVFARGPAKNLFFAAGDGQRMDIFVDMEIGGRLVVNTVPRQKSVTLDGRNAIHRVGRDSAFIRLAPGENSLAYGAETGLQRLAVKLFFTPLYLGV